MPNLRERRPPKPRVVEVFEKFNTKWSLAEKKKLLIGLKKHHEDDLEAIQAEFLPHRTTKEISFYLQRVQNTAQKRPKIPKTKVPIELWVDTAEELTQECVDYSYVLADVFAKMGKNEMHDKKYSREDPDWNVIYNYIVMLLRGEEPADVGQIEAAVLLELLESLASHLKELDITDQRKLMERKYSLLSTRVSPSNKSRIFHLACMALDQDVLKVEKTPAVDTPSTSATGAASSSSVPDHPADVVPDNSTVPPGSGETNQQNGETSETQQPEASGSLKRPAQCPPYVLKPLKAPLYSINPFCIPVKYLNPKMSTSNGENASTQAT